MKFTCHNWRKIWRGVSPWDVTFATKGHVLTCPQRGKKTWIWKLLSGFGGKKFPSLTEAAVYWNCKNKKIIKYLKKIKNLEKSREIKRNPGNMLVKKLHCLLSRGTSSVLDEMGFLVFWKQMTRQKPDLEEGELAPATHLAEQEMPFQRGDRAGLREKALHRAMLPVCRSHLPGRAAPPGPSCAARSPAGREGRRPGPLTRAVNTRITFFKSNFL